MKRFLPLSLPLGLALAVACAQAQVRDLGADAQTRNAIVTAASAPASKDLGKPLTLKVLQLRVLGDWAFVHATMLGGDGKEISYAGTRYQDAAEHGLKSDRYAALLKRDANGWHVQAHAVGPTDVAWQDWARTYGAPPALFDPDSAPSP